ncbi:MAG TPA: GNAT family N-acetyltransferase [Acholeplasmatales bacterium]|nr:MAG: hypothetical protein A2Y16_07045 [Tenericutes bacterium GWF2_57_13]HAQ56271.1 GNAT family N-acetyltransferase [Acholeplasmatales bacterium]
MFETKSLSPATWPDFERLFERHNGMHGGCWCVYHRMTMSEFIKSTKTGRKTMHHDLVNSGKASGLLLYDGDHPIGWCQFGRAEEFSAFDRMRDYIKLVIPEALKPSWRITCFVVDKERRREGLSKLLLEKALLSIRAAGGGIVEAFPLLVPGVAKPQYTGSIKMYEEHGFAYVAPIGKYNHLMRLDDMTVAEDGVL